MKVTFVFSSYGIGGAERSMLRMVERAHPDAIDASLIIAADRNPRLRDSAESLGVCVRVVSSTDVSGLIRSFREFSPDVAYLFGRFKTLLWSAAARIARVPVIIGAERSWAASNADRIGRILDSRLIDCYITNSQLAASNLRDRAGIAPNRIFVAYNGISSSTLPPPPGELMLALSPGPVIVCVASLTANKGQLILLEAVRALRPRFPGIRALLVGPDASQGTFFRDATRRRFDDLFVWTDFVTDVRPYLAAADLFVLPTLAREGMPTSTLEAMMNGIPVVCSDVGAVRELVKDNVTGLLVPPGNVHALTAAIELLLGDPECRDRLSTAARCHVEQCHGIESMVDMHVSIMRKVLAQRCVGS